MTPLIKVLRDLLSGWGRAGLMIGAMAASTAGFGTVMGAFAVLSREMPASYQNTIPASATFDIDGGVSAALLQATAGQPEVAAAVRRLSVSGRYRRLDQEVFGRAKIFVVDDFNVMPLAKVVSHRGAWPPPLGTVLIERSAEQLLRLDIGDEFKLRTAGHGERSVRISGFAYEPSLAPAETEQAIYAYMSAQTYALLGEPAVFDELRVLMASHADDRAAIAASSQRIGGWLKSRGAEVHSIRIPPPLKHPHQSQMTTVVGMLAMFGLIMIGLSGLLVAALVRTLMARQVREIGVMKAVGARNGQVLAMYTLMVGSLAIIAVLLSLVPAVLSANVFAASVSRVINFDLVSTTIPWWVFGVHASVGIGLPLLITLPTLRRGARISVTEALIDHGVEPSGAGSLTHLRLKNRLIIYALRNTLRQRRQFILNSGLLAAAGGLLISAISLGEAWTSLTDRVFAVSHYHVEFTLGNSEGPAALSALSDMAEVKKTELWASAPTVVPVEGQIDVHRTYPDESHGSFSLVAAVVGSTLVDRTIISGRWLAEEDLSRDVVVVNQAVRRHTPISLGGRLVLSVAGQPHTFEVVGIIEEVAPAYAYIPAQRFTSLAPTDVSTTVRVAVNESGAGLAAAIGRIEGRLLGAGIGIRAAVPLAVVKNAVASHFEVLANALVFLAILLTVVGTLGLSASVGANVVERTREFGVLRATGAKPAQVRFVVWFEAVFVGVASSFGAVLLAVPTSLLIGRIIGQMSFGISLPFMLSPAAMIGWAAVTVFLSVAAAVLPAKRAGDLSVHEALAHV